MRAGTQTRSQDLIEDLREARARELALFTDLDGDQLLGPQEHFLEPPIWEVGHVGWFQEYWILRNLEKAKPILEGGDNIYDSFNVSYRLRWDHGFQTRDETLDYLRTILDNACAHRNDLLAGSQRRDRLASSIREQLSDLEQVHGRAMESLERRDAPVARDGSPSEANALPTSPRGSPATAARARNARPTH